MVMYSNHSIVLYMNVLHTLFVIIEALEGTRMHTFGSLHQGYILPDNLLLNAQWYCKGFTLGTFSGEMLCLTWYPLSFRYMDTVLWRVLQYNNWQYSIIYTTNTFVSILLRKGKW